MIFARSLGLFLGLTLLLPVAAQALTPQDFASGFDLELQGESTFYELELPATAYSVLTRPDLGDLRLFNAAGAVIPHQLQPQPAVTFDATTQHRALPFFPLPASPAGELPADLTLHVAQHRDGTIVDLRTGTDSGPASGAPAGWLVDSGPVKTGRAKALTLTWTPTAVDALGEVRIDSSDDLVAWAPLTTAAIASLAFQGERLEQNAIVLPRQPRRYLRLVWPPSLQALALTAIDLSYETGQRQLPPLQHLTISGTAVAAASPRYDYLLPGPLPVEELQLQLPVDNTLAECRLDSAELASGPWQSHWRGLVYRLGRNGQQISSPPIPVNRSRHRYWRLECTPSDAGLQATPALAIGWRPDRLLFLAQGDPPYLLAVGSRQAGPARFPVDRLDRDHLAPAPVLVLAERRLGGERPLQPLPHPLPWKTILLWLLLGGGVLLIAGLAISLQRQMRNAADDAANAKDR